MFLLSEFDCQWDDMTNLFCRKTWFSPWSPSNACPWAHWGRPARRRRLRWRRTGRRCGSWRLRGRTRHSSCRWSASGSRAQSPRPERTWSGHCPFWSRSSHCTHSPHWPTRWMPAPRQQSQSHTYIEVLHNNLYTICYYGYQRKASPHRRSATVYQRNCRRGQVLDSLTVSNIVAIPNFQTSIYSAIWCIIYSLIRLIRIARNLIK